MNLKNFLHAKNEDAETYFDKKMKECGDMDVIPEELTKCMCCDRHKNNFPTLGCNLPTSDRKVISALVCDCPCRHIARHICREWDNINEVEDIDDTDSEEESVDDSYNSMDDFIVSDDETEYKFTKKARKELDKALQSFRGKNSLRR